MSKIYFWAKKRVLLTWGYNFFLIELWLFNEMDWKFKETRNSFRWVVDLTAVRLDSSQTWHLPSLLYVWLLIRFYDQDLQGSKSKSHSTQDNLLTPVQPQRVTKNAPILVIRYSLLKLNSITWLTISSIELEDYVHTKFTVNLIKLFINLYNYMTYIGAPNITNDVQAVNSIIDFSSSFNL